MNVVRFVFVGLALLLACSARKEKTVSSASWKNLVDAAKAARVPVVVRVRFVASEGANKYGWDKVRLIGILKNESGYQFPDEFAIAHYSSEPGVPEGESTVYLERYNDTDPSLWKLLNGTGKDGVSHHSSG